MNLEENMKALSQVIAKMEDKSIFLDEGIKQFEKGIGLVRECLESINASKGRITILQQEMDALIEKPFEADS